MGKISKLPDWVSNRIAAGEVVERPASVLKELVENSIDAGANYIEVSLRNGGKQLVQVTDDGEGMEYEDVILAVERHATSKIKDVEDLNSITTLGFRGEALPSIASVSVTEIVSRTSHNDMGFLIVVDNGKIIQQMEVGSAVGTTVSVSELFGKIPARKRFLKSDRAELSKCSLWLTQLSLAHPEISFKMENDEREIIYTPATGTYLERIEQIFGAEIVQDLLEIEHRSGNYFLYGYISNRTLHRSRGTDQYFFLNGRSIRSALISGALKRAYSGIIPPGRHPVVFLFLEAPPELVDVNVHPAKTEVRFRREETVFGTIYKTVANILGTSMTPAKKTKTASNMVPPMHSYAVQSKLNFPEPYRKSPGKKFRPSSPERDIQMLAEQILDEHSERQKNIDIQTEETQFLQVLNSYIVIATVEGVLILDQHAAHERVLYEKTVRALETEQSPGQRLLFPVEINLPPHWLSPLTAMLEKFSAVGFEIEIIANDKIKILSVPAFVRNRDYSELITDIMRDISEGESVPEFEKIFASSVACHSAIKAGQPLSADEMEALFDALFSCDEPLRCPHGRPTIIKFTGRQLEQMFGRT